MTTKTANQTNVAEYMQCMAGESIAYVLKNLDARALLSSELANRGLDGEGKWIGFEKAEQMHNQRIQGMTK